MAQTVVSSATSYATATDLINAHNVGQIANWATDNGVALTAGAILSDAKVAAALLRASGEVEMACFRGGRYTPADLAALTGASAAALKGLVCDLAFYHIARRRITAKDAEDVAGYKQATEMLKALTSGELIFGFQETADASNMTTVDTANDSRKLLNRPTEQARRFFGQRSDSFFGNPIPGSG